MIPHDRIPYHGPVIEGSQDRDNFIRDLVTVLRGFGASAAATEPVPPRPILSTLEGTPPVLSLDRIKNHCHIELDQTDEDDELMLLEMAARLHTQNKLRRPIDDTVGEHVKVAMLVLIAYWYRNREAVIVGTIAQIAPLAYDMLLAPERDFPPGCY